MSPLEKLDSLIAVAKETPSSAHWAQQVVDQVSDLDHGSIDKLFQRVENAIENALESQSNPETFIAICEALKEALGAMKKVYDERVKIIGTPEDIPEVVFLNLVFSEITKTLEKVGEPK